MASPADTTEIRVSFPEKLRFLFAPARYKVAYGGRGSGKSWGFARALLILAAQRPLRVLCCREIQRTIRDSVHRLLSDQISAMRLDSVYEVQQAQILGRPGSPADGSLFSFVGLRHNVSEIKSYEGIDICWVEEAQLVSKASWDTLIPTIRKDGSEIWVTFNPVLDTDETYQRFVVSPPSGAAVVKINWRDNPWFPETLRAEMEDLRAKRYPSYLNVWEGECLQALDGAVYADEIAAAQAEGRITAVKYDQSVPVSTCWDLGWADNTAIWLVQKVGLEYHVIDYIEDSRKPLQHYIREIQSRPYVYGRHYLPHDARAKELGAGLSVEEQLQAVFGPTAVVVVPQVSVHDGIQALRALWPHLWIDRERCADGLSALRHYHYAINEQTGKVGREPEHDWSSHAADALRYLAVAMRTDRPAPRPKTRTGVPTETWMSL